jgi:hypothetical protein
VADRAGILGWAQPCDQGLDPELPRPPPPRRQR